MIAIYFGSPGAGKTTLACRLIKQSRRRYAYTFCDFGCKIADFDNVDLTGLGKWTFPPNSLLVCDEAGITYNSRKFKTMPQETIKWYKLHRHYGVDCIMMSQSWEDMDITMRRLADRLYYIRKFGPFTLIRRVYKRVTIDEKTEQIIDGYKMVSLVYLLLKPLYYLSYLFFGLGFFIKMLFPRFDEVSLVWRRPYYKYFDTHAAPELPVPADYHVPPNFLRSNSLLKCWYRVKVALWVEKNFLKRKFFAALTRFKLKKINRGEEDDTSRPSSL